MTTIYSLVKVTTCNGTYISSTNEVFTSLREAYKTVCDIYNDQNDRKDEGIPPTPHTPQAVYLAVAVNEHGYKTTMKVYRHHIA